MALPEGFNSWEHLQNTLIRVHNRLVRDEFFDVGGDNWEQEITTSRSSLRVACEVEDDDSAIMVLLRFFLFYIIIRKASDLMPEIYGIPCTTFQEYTQFKPQVRLYFIEDLDEVEPGYSPVEAEISFRLINETRETMTPVKAEQLANKIANLFGIGGGFRWRKGRTRAYYKDQNKGYQLSVNAYTETEAKRVIEQVLDINNHTPDWRNLRFSKPEVTPSTIPPTDFFYGQNRRLPRKFPVANVRFRHAELHIHGLPVPELLVSSTRRRRALVYV